MRRTTLNYVVDTIFGLSRLAQGISGSILWFVLPGGYRYSGDVGWDGGVPLAMVELFSI